MKILLHICCSNCAVYPVGLLKDRGEQVTGFWSNPNIHPFKEYEARLQSVKKVEALLPLEMRYDDHYCIEDFAIAVAGNEKDRCRYCYTLRLEEAARVAAEEGYDCFSTSLLISPYQNQDLINEIGKASAERYNIEFYFEDFRSGFRVARSISKELGLYRQKYCGCIYSEREKEVRQEAKIKRSSP